MTSLTLYELSQDYQQALDALTDPEADLPLDAVMDTLEGIQGQLQDKAVNVAKFMQNLDATAQAIRVAEQQMARRRKAIEARAQWIRDYLKQHLEAAGITRIDSPWFRLAIQQNPAAVEITDAGLLPPGFKTSVTEVKIDKAAIREALRDGAEVPGAQLTRATRLVVR